LIDNSTINIQDIDIRLTFQIEQSIYFLWIIDGKKRYRKFKYKRDILLCCCYCCKFTFNITI